MIEHDDTGHEPVHDGIEDPDQDLAQGAVGAPVRTGHALVDEVLRTLEPLSELPVDQHVAVFEAAHVGLRDALSSAGPAEPSRG